VSVSLKSRTRASARVRHGRGAAATAPGAGRPARGRSAGYVFLIPWFAGFALFTFGPMVFSLYLSFTNYSLLSAPQWVGLANYRRLFTSDPRYIHSLEITAQYVVVSVPLKLAAALAVALILNRKRRGAGLYRSLFYVPSLLGASVSVALVWRAVFGEGGTLDSVLKGVGVRTSNIWTEDPRWALWTLVLLVVWQFGAPMVIFLAGLKQIPAHLYDAAAVDGANWWRRFVSITVPMLSPVIFFNLVLELVGAFQAFTPAYIVSGGTGGPADATLFYTLYMYIMGFQNFEFGYASAMAWVLLAIVGVCTALLFRFSRSWVFYADAGDR
jgi:multiple sugar transport system permease protein